MIPAIRNPGNKILLCELLLRAVVILKKAMYKHAAPLAEVMLPVLWGTIVCYSGGFAPIFRWTETV